MIDGLLSLLRYSLPVGLAAAGETVGQRSGLINIGLEGMMLGAAFAATAAANATGDALLGLGSGVVVAVAVGVLQSLLTVRFGADQVVVGTAINLGALGATGTLYRKEFGGSGTLLSLPRLPGVGTVDVVLLATPLLIAGVFWLLGRTKWGLAIRAAGEYPPAVEVAGFSVLKLRLGAAFLTAVFAGLAGGYLALGVAGSFAENMIAGRGFVAIAMVTFGRWRPLWVVAASLLVGYADSLQYELQARGLGLPPQIFIAMPYVIALLVLVFVGKGTAAPSALGVAYRKER